MQCLASSSTDTGKALIIIYQNKQEKYLHKYRFIFYWYGDRQADQIFIYIDTLEIEYGFD